MGEFIWHMVNGVKVTVKNMLNLILSIVMLENCCTFAADKGSDFADAPAISAEW